MKRMAAIFLAMVMTALYPAALAETVAEQVQAPERVMAEWTSGTGGTVIRIDAAVNVPDAETMGLIPVISVPFEDAMVPALAELLWPGLGADPETAIWNRQTYREHSTSIHARRIGGEDAEVYVHAIGRDQLKGMDGACNVDLSGRISYGHDAYDGQTVNYATYLDKEVRGTGIEGHPLTGAQAAELAKAFIRELTDMPFEVFVVGEGPASVFTDEPVPGMDYGSAYVVVLTRQVDGVPLLPSLFQNMAYWGERTDLFTAPVGYEKAEVSLDPNGRVVGFSWGNLWETRGEPVPQTLLPFEDILTIAEKVLPLKYLWLEPYTELLDISVTRIDLGYMATLQRDVQSFALTPVWTFYGDGEMLPSFQDVLTINAVDGTVIDLELGY